ncbi:FAD-binding and (Fe-S)-binding domain-containing protein [Halorussus marinus]|uniref:FAD-binding and (Fe-S)-binding domain-containing protein n=1 Tax=Halorussus marinus TaxID=2505976 RepID=UPI00106E6063|nr:FAD-binding and (Fe-S)-binding domain-containing protein [Halorussus marinus]
MASRPTGSRDPADGGDYDYRSDDVDRPGLVSDLDARVAGDVRFDSYTRQLYATDASIYEQTPIGVVFPTSTDDVAAVMTYCAEREIPVLPRGGGTSLAGQTVNEAVVLDFTRHMDGLVSFDPDEALAVAQPGITLGELNAALAPDGLKFAPDPAWGDKSVLGGAIGNNSTGAHSLKYGKTDAYVESCEVVLADGTVTTFGEVSLDELRARADPAAEDLQARIYAELVRLIDEEADEIEARFPDMKRNVSGYNLDVLVEEAREAQRGSERASGGAPSDGGSINLAKLLAGSEGTLGIVTEATVSLEPVPETKAVALLAYDDVIDAMEDVAPILEHDPAAVEVMDDVLLDLAAETDEFADVVAMLPDGTDSVLLVEFYAEDDAHGREQVADLVADRVPDATTAAAPSDGAAATTDAARRAVAAMEAHADDERARFWKMRKSGLPILLSRTGDEKHFAFLEDTAIPPENLPEYVAEFQAILDDHDTFASYYAHAGPGVLHIRPLVNTKTDDGVETMRSIADAVTDLVVKYDGSVSGEHGDGRARTQWNRKLYGERLWQSFRDLKTAFDPDWLLNPGQVCGDVDMTENLRFDPDYEFDAPFDPALDWDNENGFQGMVELCHGCAGCRGEQETTGGVMCPTYRAADEEITSTRGRANMLRRAMTGDLPDEELFSEEFADEVLDLCIGCKGCKHDCPSGVDMAKLKAEIEHENHRRDGVSIRDRLFGDPETLLSLGSAFAPLSNWATKLPGARTLVEKTVGIARDRTLPSFERETFREWFADRGPRVDPEAADRKALLVADPYTNYSHPEVGKAAVRALEAANVHVRVPDDVTDSGRPAFSKSLLDRARETARENVAALAPRVADGWDVVVAEPSDAVMFQSDYFDLLGDDPAVSGSDLDAVAASAYGVCEYLDAFGLDENAAFEAPGESLSYHGHCHQKATKKDHHAVGVLRRAGYEVDPLDSGCCGMAGSFGYEAEHFSMSEAIGEILFEQVEDSDGDVVVAPGASCRTQLGDRDGDAPEPPHPIEKVAEAVAE